MKILDVSLVNLTRRELLVRAFQSLKNEIGDSIPSPSLRDACGRLKVVYETGNERESTWIALYFGEEYETYWIGDAKTNCRQAESTIQRDQLLLSYYTWEQLRLYCEGYFFSQLGAR